MQIRRKSIISITLIWIFNLSGIIGVLVGYEDWFLSLTPLHLLIYLMLILWNSNVNKRLLLGLAIPFGIGMIAEFLGVHYGFIFGEYTYGENLGVKIFEVPLMIGVNWVILVYCTAAIANRCSNSAVIASFIGAILMVILDMVIEVSAPRFDFWEFKNGIVPLQNYIGWFVIAFIGHLLFQKLVKTLHTIIAIHIFIAIAVFFTTFLFF